MQMLHRSTLCCASVRFRCAYRAYLYTTNTFLYRFLNTCAHVCVCVCVRDCNLKRTSQTARADRPTDRHSAALSDVHKGAEPAATDDGQYSMLA